MTTEKEHMEDQSKEKEQERTEEQQKNADEAAEKNGKSGEQGDAKESAEEKGTEEVHDLRQTGRGVEEEEPASEEEIDTLQAQLDELKDKYLRLYAEFENYKKRTLRERVELRKTAARDVISVLLPVLDDFDRAKKSADDDSTAEAFSEGVSLVYNKLYSSLRQQGLQAMETEGKAFDSDLHEAVSEVPAPSDELKGKIIDTVEKGYFLNDRIIRHAKVVVGK